MTTALVIHAENDINWVLHPLISALPSLGFTTWTNDWATKMSSSHAALVVISAAAPGSEDVRNGSEAALANGIAVIPVLRDDTAPQEIAPGLERRVGADFRMPFPEAYRELSRIIPAIDPEEPSEDTGAAGLEPLDWNEEVFSGALEDTLGRRDHAGGVSLISSFERHAATRPYPYPAVHAVEDLKALKSFRKFGLMVRLGAAVLATGTRSGGAVRKLFAQALIEQRAYGKALEVLEEILWDPDTEPYEINEAKGLTGRVYKQRYVNQPRGPNAPEGIKRAIQAYGEVYDEDSTQVWHGINTASCILRAQRDGIPGGDPDRAQRIAREILEYLASQEGESETGLPIWDRATRVEAWLALKNYDEADRALDSYLHAFSEGDDSSPYPFFELAATQRQFDEVLELGKNPKGRPLLEKLSSEVDRYRSDSVLRPAPVPDNAELETLSMDKGEAEEALPLLIRVADPDWQPREDVSNLEIAARMGTVVSARGLDTTVQTLLRDLDVISVEESYPAGTEECENSISYIGASDAWQLEGEKGAGALVAVIDNGIDVLHQAFLDEQGASRIVEIWDQRDDTGPPPPGFQHGTHHTTADIAGYVDRPRAPAELGRNTRGHGTHVASIAAGRKVGTFAGGVAPEAKLVIVRSAPTGSLGYSTSHVEALHFIDGVAKKLGLPVVINVSQGMNAGAHDGKSSLEVAFNEFSRGGRMPGRVIVKSAGNERQKNGHAKVTIRPKSQEAITWERPHDPRCDRERIEVWWGAADELQFRLRSPQHQETDWVSEGPKLHGTFNSGNTYSIEYIRRHVDNGDSRLVIEILASAGNPIPAGEWKLEIRSAHVPLGGEVHAWIERSIGKPSGFTTHANEEVTLSIPGTAEDVIAVGAVAAGEFVQVGVFSSYGPTRDGRNKPEVAAPGVAIKAADGGTDHGARLDNGTSMAAPHVTGAIALLLSKNPRLTASQITTALWQTTRDFNGRWDPGQGYGVVDVGKLMQAL